MLESFIQICRQAPIFIKIRQHMNTYSFTARISSAGLTY